MKEQVLGWTIRYSKNLKAGPVKSAIYDRAFFMSSQATGPVPFYFYWEV